MPDFISIMGQGDLDGIRELTRIINEVIRKYEPRLISPVVSHVPGPSENGILEFSLSGSIEIGRARHNIFFQTSIRPDGAVNVHK
jgi:predicted component of type VI protein secretion system